MSVMNHLRVTHSMMDRKQNISLGAIHTECTFHVLLTSVRVFIVSMSLVAVLQKLNFQLSIVSILHHSVIHYDLSQDAVISYSFGYYLLASTLLRMCCAFSDFLIVDALSLV